MKSGPTVEIRRHLSTSHVDVSDPPTPTQVAVILLGIWPHPGTVDRAVVLEASWAQGVGLPVQDPGKPHRIDAPKAAQGLTPKRIAIVEQQARALSAEMKGDRRGTS